MCLQFFCICYKIILATTVAKIILLNYRIFFTVYVMQLINIKIKPDVHKKIHNMHLQNRCSKEDFKVCSFLIIKIFLPIEHHCSETTVFQTNS